MKNKKIGALIILSTMISLFGCTSSSEDNLPSIIGITTREPETHHVEGTLHKIKVSESNIPFVTNGQSDYKIVFHNDGNWAYKAAMFIRNEIRAATGVTLQTVEYNPEDTSLTYNENSKFICLNINNIIKEAGINVTTEDIGNAGYQLVTKDNSAFIYCKTGYGYVHAARMFLKQTIGYEIYSTDISVYRKSGETLPNMDIVEKPDITYRLQSNKMDADVAYKMGFLSFQEAFYGKNGIPTQHNSTNFIKPSVFQEEHPKWFVGGGDAVLDMQLCYTAHGDEEERQALIQETFNQFKIALEADPNVGTISFTQQDNNLWCDCEACTAAAKKYGKVPGVGDSAVVVLFLNEVDDLLQAYLEEQAELNNTPKREVNIVFFAYHSTEAPCVELDENGKYVPTYPEMVCNEHVSPYIAPIFADYVRSFYSSYNNEARKNIEGWNALAKRVYLWLYETNFSNYMYPYNSYSNMLETYRYSVINNAEFMFNEGQHNQNAVTAFGRFKEYLNYVAQYNVNIEYNDIVDDFFKNYFRDADEPMRKMFYEIQEHMFFLLEEYPSDVTGNIYERISQTRFWPKNLLDKWVSYIEQAFKNIEKYKVADPTLYNILYKNVLLESMFPRFAILNHYSGYYTTNEINSLVDQYIADCDLLKITQVNEANAIKDTLESFKR